jgi:hypothetical protein
VSADLVCVDPKRIHEVWDKAEPLLRAAILRTGLSAWQDIEYDILYGDALLWLCVDQGEILCAGSTSLQDVDAGRVCVITACGGSNLNSWKPLLSQIEQYARREKCIAVRIFGRRGWLRALNGYHETNIVLDKELN